MRREIIGVLAPLMLLTGCSWIGIFQVDTLHWYKPEASYRDYIDVRRVCILEARERASPGGVKTDNSLSQKGQVVRGSDFIRCMQSKGYAVDPNGFGPPGDTVYIDPNS